MPFCVTAHVSFIYFGCSTVVFATTTEPIGSRNCVRFAGSICPQPTKKRAVQNGSRTIMNARRSGPTAIFAARWKRWTSSATHDPNSSQNAQRNYERYLALARAEAKSATRSGQRITTNTPNIISDRCAQTKNGRKRLYCDGHLRSGRWR
jgi:hypothetical protein